MKTDIAQFLTPKQRLFCDEYLIDLNATRAALRAGYSRATALNGSLMQIPKIKMYLQERTEDLTRKAQVSQEMVLAELCKIAFGNIGNYFGADGSVKLMQELTDDERAALWSVSVSDAGSGSKVAVAGAAAGPDGGIVKFRMYNKLSALDKIAKHINFYKPEEKRAEKVYVYLSKEDMVEDDFYDDEDVEEDFEENQESRCKNQEGFSGDERQMAEESRKQDAERCESGLENGPVVSYDGAGMGYKASPQPSPKEREFDLQDDSADFEKVVVKDSYDDEQKRLHLSLNERLRAGGVSRRVYTNLSVLEKMRLLR